MISKHPGQNYVIQEVNWLLIHPTDLDLTELDKDLLMAQSYGLFTMELLWIACVQQIRRR